MRERGEGGREGEREGGREGKGEGGREGGKGEGGREGRGERGWEKENKTSSHTTSNPSLPHLHSMTEEALEGEVGDNGPDIPGFHYSTFHSHTLTWTPLPVE